MNSSEEWEEVIVISPPESSRGAERSFTQEEDMTPRSSSPTHQIHTGGKSQSSQSQVFSCPECLYSFTSQIFLHKHIKWIHSELYGRLLESGEIRPESLLPPSACQPIGGQTDPDRCHRCQQCDRAFTTLGSLKNHTRIHTGEKPYSCQQCGRTFSQLSNLSKHQLTHTGERPHSCDQCGKGFSTSQSLVVHRRIHSGERPYQCSQCDKRFATSQKCTVHQRIHTGERPYHCDLCGRSFCQLNAYRQHLRTHTGERPFHCLQCEKRFTSSANLAEHQRIHSGEKPYWCQRCKRNFTRSGHLKRHRCHRWRAIPVCPASTQLPVDHMLD